MENYKELGNRYLKQHKRRSILTILGCMIVAACIFAFLNYMCNWLEHERNVVRKTDDFEILILTDDKDKIEAIVNEDFVRSAYIGKAYSWTDIQSDHDYYEPDEDDEDGDTDIYANALHINLKNILFVNHYNEYIQDKYDVKTELNSNLLWTYFLDDSGSDDLGFGIVLLIGGIFIAYIFSIIGVGIIRNSVQLSALERIKDYGNLRCIGATKKQIKRIVFRESLIIETIGIVSGILLGYLISIPFCNSKDYPVSFHILPVILIFITFYFDMWFAIGDGVKKVLKVSPIEAVKGNYRIKNKKLKRRRSGIWKLIFGIEGDYAYKNIKRNNGRFLKTVFAMAFGLGTVVFLGGVLGVVLKYIELSSAQYGYYQHFIEADTFTIDTEDEMKAQLYSPDAVKKITSANGVDNAKYIYSDTLYMTEKGGLKKHLNDEFLNGSLGAYQYLQDSERKHFTDEEWKAEGDRYDEMMKEYRQSGKGLVDYEALETIDEDVDINEQKLIYDINFGRSLCASNFKIYGYDEEDYARYKDSLVEGSMELSENGILLVNQGEQYDMQIMEDDNDSVYVMPVKKNYTYTDYKLGDEIQIVDPVELDMYVREELENAEEYDASMHKKADDWDKEHGDETDENGEKKINPYSFYMNVKDNYLKSLWIVESARQKLVEEGKYKTYVIEGILNSDPNRNMDSPTIIVPQDKFFDMTGKTEIDYTGFQFHISNYFSSDLTKDDFINAINETEIQDEEGYTYTLANRSYFLDDIGYIVDGIKQMLLVGLVIFIIVLVSAFNTMNATISNLQLRRNEFAQLRALGMTKKSLLKSVILEGGIVWIVSSIIGLAIGIMVELYFYETVVRYVIEAPFYIAWIPIIIALVLGALVLCGTNIVTFRNMKLNVANELSRSGE